MGTFHYGYIGCELHDIRTSAQCSPPCPHRCRTHTSAASVPSWSASQPCPGRRDSSGMTQLVRRASLNRVTSTFMLIHISRPKFSPRPVGLDISINRSMMRASQVRARMIEGLITIDRSDNSGSLGRAYTYKTEFSLNPVHLELNTVTLYPSQPCEFPSFQWSHLGFVANLEEIHRLGGFKAGDSPSDGKNQFFMSVNFLPNDP